MMAVFEDVVNITYWGNKIAVLLNDGRLFLVERKDLEYPYFYSDVDFSGQYGVVSSVPMKVKFFTGRSYEDKDMYKIELLDEKLVYKYKRKSSFFAEADVPYLDRRLGADGVIVFAKRLQRYAYLDIEETGGIIHLIGLEFRVDDSGFKGYIGLWREEGESDESFFTRFGKILKDNRITTVLAWNGDSYDFDRIDKHMMKSRADVYSWWKLMLKLDAMKVYSRYNQTKSMISLEEASKDMKIEGKLKINKPMAEWSKEEWLKYNEQDVEVLKNVLERGFLHINTTISNETGISIKEVSAIRMTLNLMLKDAKKNNIVLGNVKSDKKSALEGALMVERGVFGVVHNVAVFDFNSLYPNVILNFDYEGEGKELYQWMRKFIKYFLEKRAEYKTLYKNTGNEEYNYTQQMYKIFANSVYGAMSSTNFSYYIDGVGSFVTAKGREMNRKLQAVVKDLGYLSLYGDTDSVFVDNVDYEQGKKLEEMINRRLYPFKVKFERWFKSFMLMRKIDNTVRKKGYFGVTKEGEIYVKGIEMKRSDWTELSHEVEERVLVMLLKESKDLSEVVSYVESVLKGLRSIQLEKLLFTKSYDKSKKYKVRVRQLKAIEQLGGVENFKQSIIFVKYFIGDKGEPIAVKDGDVLEGYRDKIDYRWYALKQIKSPIDRILQSVSGDFEGIDVDRYYPKVKRVRKHKTLTRVKDKDKDGIINKEKQKRLNIEF